MHTVYINAFHVCYPKVCATLELCPNSGLVILELCQKILGQQTVHTLLDLISVYDSVQMPFDLKITILADVIEGLAYLHSRGIMHGDVKPLNVLVCGEEFVFKVADYGCPVSNNSMPISRSTTMKQLMTPGYRAPELFPVSDQTGMSLRLSKASDIYSFATLAYELMH